MLNGRLAERLLAAMEEEDCEITAIVHRWRKRIREMDADLERVDRAVLTRQHKKSRLAGFTVIEGGRGQRQSESTTPEPPRAA